MDNSNQDISHLLPLYFEGKLDNKQTAEVEKWMELSDTNRQIAADMKEIYQATDTLFALDNTDTDAALARVHRRMGVRNAHYVLTWMQRAAAILFIPLLAVTLLKFYSDRTQEPNDICLSTNPGMTATTTLPDGTMVTLNSSSSISYPSRFNGDERRVLLNGEGYFKVTKDKSHPFIVSTPQKASIQVYGTQFDVEAYSKDNTVTATLVEGSIAMKYEDKRGTPYECKIIPGLQISFNATNHSLKIANAKIDVTTSWKDGKLILRDTPFMEVLKILSKRFDVDFIVKNPNCKENSFTGTLDKPRLERILEYLNVSSNIHFKYIQSKDIRKERQTIEIN